MPSKLCVSMALCLVLTVSAGCNVIRTQKFPLSPAGLTVDVVVRNKEHHTPPVKMFSIDVDKNTKKVTVFNFGVVPKRKKSSRPVLPFVPSLDDRLSGSNKCPYEYTRVGWHCVPDEDLEEDEE